jgi:hypothetical protein
MGNLFRRQVGFALYAHERAQQYQFLMSTIRAILQTAAVSVLEYCALFVDDVEDSRLRELAVRFLKPSDGMLEEVLSEGLALMRNNGIRISDEWLKGHGERSLRRRVIDWAVHRNNRDGHGVVSVMTVEEGLEWLPTLASDLLDGLAPLMPSVDDDGKTHLTLVDGQAVTLGALRLPDQQPIVIRQILQRGDCWRVKFQSLDLADSQEGSYDVPGSAGFFVLTSTNPRTYQQYHIPFKDSIWRPTVLLPGRQTAVFEGRERQLGELRSWFADSDSRACNVYGEGGIGKTTLVLEFLNAILSGEVDPPVWRPEVICFFSAKQTRWGSEGLQILHGIVPPIEDAIRELVRSCEDRLDNSWYEPSVETLVAKARTMLTDLGISRDDVLLILDNTETLASSASEEAEFARAVGLISRSLGRVLVTSRRREQMEAYPILVPSLSESEGVALLERLAVEYQAKPLAQSGRPAKRKLTSKFGGRPLLLDVFARLVGRFQYSLDSARDAVLRLASDDLGTFLYDDTWGRMSREERLAFVALGQLGDTISGRLVEFVCSELNVQHSMLLDSYEKTRFGSRLDYSTSYDLVIDPSARAFLAQKFNNLSPTDRRLVETAAAKAGKRHRDLLRAHASKITDRVVQAFRTDAAKAAKIAAARGDVEDAIFWFEEAIKADVSNPALMHRFAFFLSKKGKNLERAYALAKQACELDLNDDDCHFTAGCIAASLGEVLQADQFLARAESLGFSAPRCALQRAKARVRAMERSYNNGEPPDAKTRADTRRHIRDAEVDDPQNWLDEKHVRELRRLENRLEALHRRRTATAASRS